MAITGDVTIRHTHEQLIHVQVAINDEQNTGEVLNLTFDTLPNGVYFVNSIAIWVDQFTTTPAVVDGDSVLAYILDSLTSIRATALIPLKRLYLETDAAGSPTAWQGKISFPFAAHLFRLTETIRDSMRFDVPPADANATPIGVYNLMIELTSTRNA